MKRLIIEQLKEGYNLIDEAGDKYAVLEDTLSERVGVYFGLTKHKEKNNIAPPAKVSEATKPDTQGSDMAASSKPAGTTLQSSSTDQAKSASNITDLQSAGKQEISNMDATHLKLGTPDNYVIMKTSDLEIPKFRYDKSKMQPYESIFFQEFPDGAVVLGYGNSHYYTIKEKVLKIPYPSPKEYFSKENGWSSTIEIAFKKYRKYLFEKRQEQQIEKKRTEDPDDWKYKNLLHTNTRTDYDGNKIEGSLEG